MLALFVSVTAQTFLSTFLENCDCFMFRNQLKEENLGPFFPGPAYASTPAATRCPLQRQRTYTSLSGYTQLNSMSTFGRRYRMCHQRSCWPSWYPDCVRAPPLFPTHHNPYDMLLGEAGDASPIHAIYTDPSTTSLPMRLSLLQSLCCLCHAICCLPLPTNSLKHAHAIITVAVPLLPLLYHLLPSTTHKLTEA